MTNTTGEEICDLISKKYESIWEEKEDLGLVKLENMGAYNHITNAILLLESMEQNIKVTIAYAHLLEAKRNMDGIMRRP